MSVAAVQFLKGAPSGECESLERLGIAVFRCAENTKFLWNMTEEEKILLCAAHGEMLRKALGLGCDMLILDELCDAYGCGVIDKSAVCELLENPPCELVITGHNPDEIFFDCADYITEMKKLAHPFDKGAAARKGIEY
jgi:cob(I)alamin adenosyltransferase